VLRECAEYLNSFEPPGPDEQRVETPRFTLLMGIGDTWNTVQRQDFAADEVDDVLAEVRELVRARGRRSVEWEIGSSARPAGLVDMLLARGLVPHHHDDYAVALVLRAAPPPAPAEMTARAVSSLAEFAEACGVQQVAFEATPEQVADDMRHLERRWDDKTRVMHAVWLDGRIVGAGTCVLTDHGVHLHGGATLPDVRGRGAYRALLAARWAEAVSRGTPVLLTQGGSRSLPILERVGFERVGHVHMLVDRFDSPDSSQ
jgi:GNAT superfamily N-acetyltransferase